MQIFADKGIKLDATAGESHWQLGIVERMIATIFNSAEQIANESDLEFPRAVSMAVKAQKTVDRVKGYTPSQWSFGHNPSWTDTLHDELDEISLSRDASDQFAEKQRLQIAARNIYETEVLNQKLLRAQRAQSRKDKNFCPGEIVYVWRQGVGKLAGTSKTGLHRGQWFGPGTILGTETRLTEKGTAESGSILWVIINDRLWRCSAPQVRKGSEREIAQQTLLQAKPWTFQNITKDLIIGQYRDITGEAEPPPMAEEEEGVEPEEMEMEDPPEDHPPGGSSSSSSLPAPKRKRIAGGNGYRYPSKMPRNANLPQRQKAIPTPDFEAAGQQATAALHMCEEGFFCTLEETPERCLEIAFPALENERQIRKFLKNPEAFVVTSLRKKRVEVNEKRLNPEEREMMRTVKGKEVREFIKEKAVERLREGEYVDPKDVMKMRFVLTWKNPDAPNGVKGKARLVILGFQDPWLGKEKTSAPTLNKRSKQLVLQVIVQRGWRLMKGDVTAAFLQGRPLNKNKYALAPPELAEALGLPPGERVVRLLKSVYGLTAAPLEWYEQVNKVLTELGFVKCHSDPTVWVLHDPKNPNETTGIIGAHVDDFLMAGEGPYWEKCIETLLTAFRWTPLEKDRFKQCGVVIEQLPDNSIVQHQDEYMSCMGEVDLKPERAKQMNSPVTEQERTELRALLGGMQWLVGQTMVSGNVDVNVLQSDVSTATVETILTANKVLRKLRNSPNRLYTRKIESSELHMVAWSDASWANRKSGSSTGGFLVGLCGKEVLEGERGHVTVVSWATNKLKRVARCSMAAEVQALADAEESFT
jgi:hypothetical protein